MPLVYFLNVNFGMIFLVFIEISHSDPSFVCVFNHQDINLDIVFAFGRS